MNLQARVRRFRDGFQVSGYTVEGVWIHPTYFSTYAEAMAFLDLCSKPEPTPQKATP